ncbi:MAG TPA: L-2-hydroxyglutarate oxidase [Candidatus Omnitrophica bacterium]|nr:MAG: FAD-dependent oxidoreductase [Omnitrophica WOR_2 bacterium GWA2_45_18]OGX19312.1 MAG: FAD-dependent oxidoreductase [Omnitrophica WOR_2 bacterium GWC2_45_7]HBR15892.1 L-2-hydroxyglutarate oxidase [Candidatus Omnitrophota bacterium]
MNNSYTYIIIGAGITGLSIAFAIKKHQPGAQILILEKEEVTGFHASGRNSGVLHAGFYYTADSLKAKFTVAGSRAMKEYCRRKNLPLNECGKLVVAQNEDELTKLYELEKRGKTNGSNVSIIDESRAAEIEPNVRTFKKALYSPETAGIDPKLVCTSLKNDLEQAGVRFLFSTRYLNHTGNILETTQGKFEGKKIINCSGLYADQIAQDFGFGRKYTIIPFKGLYLKYTKNKTDVKTNIYPVPNLKNPFLGVHFTKTVTGDIKIGPTAIPALWRENYFSSTNFNLSEFVDIFCQEAKLFLTNAFGFRDLAFEEMKKYDKKYFISLAQKMVQHIDEKGFTEFTQPGIRAQLLNKKSLNLVQDFILEGDTKSIHILNAVSPAFTCTFPFGEYVVKHYILP